MCLIMYQPAGEPVFKRSAFKNGWSANKDGAGYMFAHRGELIIRKPFYRLKDLWEAYQLDHDCYGDTSPFVVHLRYSTHGSKAEMNVHPHPLCDGRVGLVHNGILDFEPPYTSDISDTVFFCRTVLANRQPSFIMGHRCNSWLREMIGESNKFVLLDNRGKVSIVNDAAGVWDGNCWYSNNGYLHRVKSLPPQWRLGAVPDLEIPSHTDHHPAYAGLYDRAAISLEELKELDCDAWRDACAAMERSD